MARAWLLWGCLLAMLSVILGAFAAHSLKAILAPDRLKILATANHYLGYHALALVALGLWSSSQKKLSTKAPGFCFILGSFVFSGSLYALVLLEQPKLGMITPIGGVLFIVGWALFALKIFKSKDL